MKPLNTKGLHLEQSPAPPGAGGETVLVAAAKA